MEIAVLDPLWCEILPDLDSSDDDSADDQDRQRSADDVLILRAAATAFAAAAPVALRQEPAELSLVLVDDAQIRDLNRNYRGFDKPTNVLSFAALDGEDAPPAEGPRLLGDVILARETIVREAAEQDKRVTSHITHLVVHGVLHLLGFDHELDEDAEEMEGHEVAILAKLGIADPYGHAHGDTAQSGQASMAGSQ